MDNLQVMKYRHIDYCKLICGGCYIGTSEAFNHGVLWNVSRTITASGVDACVAIEFKL